MKSTVEYIIPFKGLKEGIHQYEFAITSTFFNHFEGSEINNANITVSVTLTNRPSFLVFEIELEGTVNALCDRCLEYFDLPVKSGNKLVVKFGEKYTEETDELITIPESEHQFDLSHYIYEFINLCLPYRRVHPNKQDCNKKTINRLKEIEITTNDSIDPRWNRLKEL
jgi:uncharacterized metal-binding protein YceD (DUF177 family)